MTAKNASTLKPRHPPIGGDRSAERLRAITSSAGRIAFKVLFLTILDSDSYLVFASVGDQGYQVVVSATTLKVLVSVGQTSDNRAVAIARGFAVVSFAMASCRPAIIALIKKTIPHFYGCDRSFHGRHLLWRDILA